MDYRYLEFYHEVWFDELADVYRVEVGEDGVESIYSEPGESEIIVAFESGKTCTVNSDCVRELDYV